MEYYRLTAPQQNIWNLQKYYEGTSISNLCGAIFYQDRRDSSLLRQAIYQFIQNQRGMRLQFTETNKPMQYISEEITGEIPIMTFASMEEFEDYAKVFAKKPIGLIDRALYRFVIFQVEDKSGVLSVLSHLISDAWTFSLMANQVEQAYHNLMGEADNDIFEADYTDYIQAEQEYLLSDRYRKDKLYWENKYAARPEKSIIKIYPSNADSIEADRITKQLSSDLECALKKYCSTHRVTPAVLFETALIIYLSQINQENASISIGVPVLNRSSVREKKTAGMYVSTMPLTITVKKDMTVKELTEGLAKEHMDLFRHQKYAYSDILKCLREKQNFFGNLYDVMISYQNAKTDTGADTKWYSNGYSEVPLVIHIDNRDEHNSHTINVDYQTAVFKDEREAAYMIERLEYILFQITQDEINLIKEIKIVPSAELTKILEAFNDTYVEYPREKCIHELFSAQAQRTPDKAALIFEDREFTYRQLDEMSNSLAHFLREKGVKRNDVVPIVAKRSWHVIVAMLGVLKAGGAYMPVDPDYPADRIRYMLSEINSKMILAYGYVGNKTDIEAIDLEKFDYKKAPVPISCINQPQDYCYVLYTSGSTGKPKATMISHSNLGNFVDNNNNNKYQCAMTNQCERVLADTAFIFDISVFEIYLTLLNGLTVILSKEMSDASYLAGLIEKHKVDVMHTTPTKILMLLQNKEFQKAAANIKMLMIGAETFSEELYRTISSYTDAVIYNGYGPTEATIGCSFKRLNHREKCIHELFTAQAQRTPDKAALIAGDDKYTYRELDEKSDALAQKLIQCGVSEGNVIGAYLDRTAYTVISQLAVLKACGIFLPIDHRYPTDRIKYMLEDCKVKLVLSDRELGEAWDVEYVNLRKYDFKDVPEKTGKQRPEAPCYVIYTSGSTGKPKGCVLKHAGVANFCLNNNIVPYAEKLDHQTVVSVNTISFDYFIAETLLPLVHGWTVVLAGEEESSNKKLFKELIVKNGVNIIETTPTRLGIYTEDEKEDSYMQQIQMIVTGGEELSETLFQQMKKVSRAKIFNIYGPSECSVWNLDGDFKTDITIGSPIANTQIYILDRDKKPLPIGVAGELCIAGEGVGLGYLNQPELTAERFVKNPFATEGNHHGKVMYHTGDLACWRADGEIEYLGRIDTQVKIRGLRIELGEIESVMSGFPQMKLTAVADKRDENNRQYLVGYYTAEGEINEKELRNHLTSKLPKYMVPNYFVRLEEMPMTASGKTDRKNLPMPEFTVETGEYAAPETDIEKKLAAIWQQLLKIETIGKTDDFFELGGDSLLAISMLNEIEDVFHSEIGIKNIMEHTTLEQLALCVQNADNMAPIPVTGENIYKLLPQQKAIYAIYSKDPDSLVYNMPAHIPLPENVDIAKLQNSIYRAIRHHKVLMSYIKTDGDEIIGVYDNEAKLVFERYETDKAEGFVRPFDLSKAPLVRIGFTEKKLLFDMHHIVADGETLNIVLRDILREYEGIEAGDERISYADYAEYFYQRDMTKHIMFFKEQLRCDFEPVMLPKTKQPSEGGLSRIYKLKEEAVAAAGSYGRKHNLTDTMVFFAAYGILLSKYSGNQDVLSSIVLKNRIHSDTRNMAGMFVNTLPVHLAAHGTVTEYMQKVEHLLLGLFEHQEMPFAFIADAVGMTDKGAVNTSFVYQADGDKVIHMNGQQLVPELVHTHTAKFDLMMELTPCESGMKVRLEYNCEKYDINLMYRLADAYSRILLQLDKEDIADINVMPPEEYYKVVEAFNDTYVEYPREKCIHELFSAQAQRTPDKAALIFEDREFTYRQLDEMSNSLAHFLREKGVKRNDVVPIVAKRSWHVIVAMLGVLKAGGAYMPVSPEFPPERMRYMFVAANVRLALTYGCSIKTKNYESYATDIEVISLETIDYYTETLSVPNRNDIEDMCYIIFTSGSTGQPKGVVINHRNVSNYCSNNNNNNVCHKIISEGNKSIVSVTNIVFDIFVTESLLPLVNGLTVYLANDDEIMSQNKLAKLIKTCKIDVLQTTPTKMKSYMLERNNLDYFSVLKTIILGGEALPEKLYKDIAAYSKARVFNIYGPAETTVWSTNSEITGADITIGSPIANTQIYILDRDKKPLPIGVAGELCIAGEGVGLGYLNQPELTAERFVKNPFATEENHHGKVMYHTGDLACWRADGEIEYLGRIDTQVKIRGLRIELGEIESVMSGFPEIKLTAVADKRDENNRQYLVGYYTAEGEINEKELRNHLTSKLPKYMVPNYFVRLEEMPMTASGKMDRKNLPMPEFTVEMGEYAAPETEQETKLCSLLAELLHMERVSAEDDFFEYGGDSLTAIEYVAKAHGIGIEFSLQNVFDYPTVRKLCGFLNAGAEEKVHYDISDFDKYSGILGRNVADETVIPEKKSLGNVLLTGATGFLGAHVLDRLMQEETGKIYCLIRSNQTDDRRGRWKEILRYYFGDKYELEMDRRIIPIVGDIERDGLSDCMPSDVQTVIHTAASVKHFGAYNYFHKVNTEGTRHVLDYAKSVGAKLIHISTLSVSGNSMADDFTVYHSEEEKFFGENSFYIGQPLDNVYIRSKFEAEKSVYDAVLDGLDAVVIRVGNLTNRASDYKFQTNFRENAFLTRVKAILEFGLFPDYLMKLYAEFSPVDKTAEGIVRLAQYSDGQTVFHLNSDRVIYFDRFLELLGELGIPMKVVDGDTFNGELQKTMKTLKTEYIYEAFQNDMDEQGQLVYDSNIHIENDFTLWFLKKTGFEWNETDMEYIRGYIEYFRKIGYLEV